MDAGGEPNQVLGDGLLALFGMSDPPDVACRQAIVASAAIAERVGSLNTALAHALVEPIRFGVGIHAGVTVAGAIGYERHAQFTVIGDPVNVAARLQDLTKAIGCEVLMSEEVYERAGFGSGRPPRPRGRDARTRGERESPQRRAGGGSGRPDRGAGAGGVSGWNRRAVPRTPRPARTIRRFGDPSQFNGKKALTAILPARANVFSALAPRLVPRLNSDASDRAWPNWNGI